MMRFCSPAVPSEVIRNSAVTSGNSSSAFSTPRLAMVQKSAELFVTKASFTCLAESLVSLPELHAAQTRKRQRARTEDFFIAVSSGSHMDTVVEADFAAPSEEPEKTYGRYPIW